MNCDQTKNKIDYTLYLVTDRSLMTTDTLESAVEQAIAGGCTVVQLREKEACTKDFFEMACRIRTITKAHHVPLFINDRLDIALAVGADGVHLGQNDLPCKEARNILGDKLYIGVSAATVAEAKQAEADGADYLGVGALNTTSTKLNTRSVTPTLLAEIKQSVSIPVVAIGGIQPNNLPLLRGTKIDGIAVVSAILAQPDITNAAHRLKQIFMEQLL